jgi:signal transduction histidine kinase
MAQEMRTTLSRSSRLSALAAALLAGSLVLAVAAFAQLRGTGRTLQRTADTRILIDDVRTGILEAETGERGYVITGHPEYLEPYRTASARENAAMARLSSLSMGTPTEQRRIDEADRLVRTRLAQIGSRIEARDHGGLQAAAALIATGEGERTMDDLRTQLRAMEDEQDRLLATERRARARYAGGTLGALMVTSALFGLLVLRSMAYRRLAEERARTAEFQERFVAIVGHDLRSPLTSMTLGVQSLKRTIGPQHADILRRMGASGARMERMIEQLLDLARSRLGGGIRVVLSRVDFGTLVEGVAEELRASWGEGTLQVDVQRGVDGQWDGDRLGQVVSNLVGNALAYRAPDTIVRLSVRAQRDDAVLTVHNDGPPIPATLIPVLFDPFRRGEQGGRSAHTAGLGLGLFITRELVAAHGGTIGVESDERAGTTFTVTLGRSRPRSPEPPSSRTLSRAGRAPASPPTARPQEHGR